MKGYKHVPVEIQIRTMLQDAWGELEHDILYKKGTPHPHIKKSFILLARELQTNDQLVSHLRKLSDIEKGKKDFFGAQRGWIGFYDYEGNQLPRFYSDQEISSLITAYFASIKTGFNKVLSEWDSWTKDIEKQYKYIAKLIQLRFTSRLNEKKIKYWLEMEQAFILFCKGKYDKAKDLYKKIIEYSPDKYIPHFRIGQISILKEDAEGALISFDECEKILNKAIENSPDPGLFINKHYINFKLAYTYWMLGSGYFEISTSYIRAAHRILRENRDYFPNAETRERFCINNLCWYNLDLLISAHSDKNNIRPMPGSDRVIAKLQKKVTCLERIATYYYKKLYPFLTEEDAKHFYDTAAWYNYVMYKITNKYDYLREAKQLCQKIIDAHQEITYTIIRSDLQFQHIAEIIGTDPDEVNI